MMIRRVLNGFISKSSSESSRNCESDEPGLVKDAGEDDFSPPAAAFLLGAFIDLLLLLGRHIINQIHK